MNHHLTTEHTTFTQDMLSHLDENWVDPAERLDEIETAETVIAPVAPAGYIKCGNRAKHGRDRAYHPSRAVVAQCCGSTPTTQAPVRPTGPAAWATIPVGGKGFGFYALRDEQGTVTFYRVERPSTGKWAGRTFVKVQISDNFHRIERGVALYVLSEIAADPQAAGLLYAQEARRCTRCGKALTLEESRTVGMGSTCARKGWAA